MEFAGHMRGPSLNYIEKKKKSCTSPVTEARTLESFSALILLFLHLYVGPYCDPIPGNSLKMTIQNRSEKRKKTRNIGRGNRRLSFVGVKVLWHILRCREISGGEFFPSYIWILIRGSG